MLALLLAGHLDANGAEAMAPSPHRFHLQVIADYQMQDKVLDIRARIDGSDCGALATSISAPSELHPRFVYGATYIVDVASEEDKAGCGAPGRTIHWTVNGRAADQETSWPTSPEPTNLLLSVGPMPMVLTGRLSHAEGLAGDEPAEVTIGGYPCGRAGFVRAAPRGVGGLDGYGAIVLPYEADPHCGRDGDRVQITIGGRPATETISWSEGRHQVDLTLAEPRTAESGESDEDRWQWFSLGLTLGALAALAAFAGFVALRRLKH